MRFRWWRPAGYLFLTLTGWAAGRWFWPGEAGEKIVESSWTGLQSALPLGEVVKAPPVGDGGNLALELRAAGPVSEADFRRRARHLALAPPPALADFLGVVTDAESLRASLLEDAAVWAYCRNPAAGLALLASLPGTAESAVVVKKALGFFPPKDLPLVRAWFERLPASEVKTAALKVMLPVLSRQDFAGAIALVASLPQEGDAAQSQRRNFLQELTAEHAPDTAYQAMLDGLERFPAEDRQSLEQWAKVHELGRLQETSPEKALAMVTSLQLSDQAPWAAEIFRGWAMEDPTRAAPYLEQLPDDLKTDQVYTGFAETWAWGNGGMASQWVKALPEGAPKQAAVQGLVKALKKDFPLEALTWAATLADPAGRQTSLQSVLGEAPEESRQALSAALNTLPLSHEEKALLRLPPAP